MKKYFFVIIITMMTHLLSAQSEPYRIALKDFEINYNGGNYVEIFNRFSSEMKQALPLAQTVEYLTALKSQFGSIETANFITYHQRTYAKYETKFERMILAVNISIDKENLINGLFIEPYEASNLSSNQPINALHSYPKEIANIIFSNTKDFPNHTQLSIAVVKNGKTNYYGMIKANDSVEPIINQTKVFEIGSITKVFTSSVLASLVVDGKIKLDEAINTYYDFPFKDQIHLNFRDLANHTSGLPRLPENLDFSNNGNPYQHYGKNEIKAYLMQFLKVENAQSYAYSNLGTGLLGYTLGLSQKVRFETLLQQRVFDKYGMKNTFISSKHLGDQLVKGRDSDGKITSNWDWDVLFGAGGILSTTTDLVKFAEAQFNPKNKALQLTRTVTAEVNDSMKIGLGWHLLKSKSGKDLIWHNGGTGGYSSSMIINTNDKTAVVILSNLSAFHHFMQNIDQLCFDLMHEIEQ